jgi:exonuclease SbcC
VVADLDRDGKAVDLAQAEAAVAEAAHREQESRLALATLQSRAERLGARLVELDRQLEGAPPGPELESILSRLEAHESEAKASQLGVAQARSELEALDQRLAGLGDRLARLRSDLQQQWSRLVQAGLDLPSFDPGDPVGGWRRLIEWRGPAQTRLEEAREKAARLVDQVNQRRDLVLAGLRSQFQSRGLEADSPRPRDLVVDALSGARTERARVLTRLEEAAAAGAEREAADRDQRLARQLNLELRADRFKKWLFDEIFTALVDGANSRLADLTRGQYELVMEGRNFEVIDNLSAGNRRSVKTLSGGETFLVSLALALSLADQVAENAGGAAGGRLESFFLDEGFGTLDAESLDQVGGVIAELGAMGKTVGIVTHVPELAERMPVRYLVTKAGGTARVEMVGT